jgi:eukaryotic-like serine/threonine-protein kinase
MPTISECPQEGLLKQMVLGQVSPADADSLEAHVLCCPRCARVLQGLNAEDQLVEAMRAARNQPAVLDAAEALIPWLKRLRPADETTTLSLSGSPLAAADRFDSADTMPSFDFLAKAMEPDELGRLSHYRVLDRIGIGGMGMVFLAHDERLKRQVAIKVIKPALLQRTDLHERFLSEAQAIAAVEHDNIVAVYSIGDAAGMPYLVMPFLRGQSLEDHLQKTGGPLPIDEILRIGREAAAGLAAAHERNLIHRDIKPNNLWLESSGQEAAGSRQLTAGRVKILDFGLARALQGLDQDDEQDTILGTPAYMSPEQGRGGPVDARTDLFSLGCVMYRTATGRAPFQGEDVITTLHCVANATPESPKQLNPELPIDLARLIEKLLAKNPEERHSSAAEVVAAIQAIERGRQSKHIGRWLLATAACVALAVGATFGVWSYIHRPIPCEVTLAYEGPDAVLVIQRGTEFEQEIEVRHARTLMLLPGEYGIRAKEKHQTKTIYPDHFTVHPREPIVLPLQWVGQLRRYDGHSLTITGVAFTPRKDSSLALSASVDRSIGLWDTSTDAAAVFLEDHDQTSVHCVAFSPDGKRAISGSGIKQQRAPDNCVRLWDLADKTAFAPLTGHQSAVTAVAYDPKDKTFLSGDQDGMIFFWDAQTCQRIDALQGHDQLTVKALAYLPDGTQALSGGGDGKLLLWDVAKRSVLKSLQGHTKEISGVSAAPDGKHAASASFDGTIRVWDLRTGESRGIEGHEGSVHCVSYAPDGKTLLSGGKDNTVRLWNADRGELLHTYLGHKGTVHGVAFSADGRRAISGGSDRTLRLWELPK